MDLRVYFQKIREVEAKILDACVVVVSLETPDGGKAGVLTEVLPRLAAKLVVDGLARLANEAESRRYREQEAEAKRAADEQAAAARVQLTVIPASELEKLRSAPAAPRK